MAKKANGEIPTNARFDKLVRNYVAVRDKITEMEKAIEPYTHLKERINAALVRMLDQAGAQSVRTEHGTASITIKPTASLSDPDAFMQYVIDNQRFDLLNRHANPNACREFADTTGALPPGVKLNTVRRAGVRK